jgi:hypothetical protein
VDYPFNKVEALTFSSPSNPREAYLLLEILSGILRVLADLLVCNCFSKDDKGGLAKIYFLMLFCFFKPSATSLLGYSSCF